MKELYKNSYTYLGIAAAGVYANEGDNVSVSIPDRRLIPYLGDLCQGGVVLDKRPCVDKAGFFRLVVDGPLMKESLPGGTMIPHYSRQREIVPCLDASLAGCDAYVAKDIYVEMWKKFGARVGYRVKDTIHWDDGEVFPIPSEEDRWKAES